MKVDTRAGSMELIAPLRLAGVTVEECILNSGDIEILGNGPGGASVLVGVEHKSVEDALASLRNGRLAEQLRRMRQDYNISWLLIEGEHRKVPSKYDNVQVRSGAHWVTVPGSPTIQGMYGGLLTMMQAAGVLYWSTRDQAQSVQWLRSLERWWTAKDWEQHRSHLDWYRPEVPHNPFEGEPPLVQKVAFLLPHIGSIKADKAAKHFRSVKKLVDATVEEWQSVVGLRTAEAVVKAVEEEV